MDDPRKQTLGSYEPTHLRFDCARCRRHGQTNTWELRRRYGDNLTLHDVALKVAGEGGCQLAADGICGVRAIEPPVDEWATLYHAYHGGWLVEMTCGRRHAALKAAKSCPGVIDLDIETLNAVFGGDLELIDLARKLRCPKCGTTAIHLQWFVPPPGPPPKPATQRQVSQPRLSPPRGLKVVGGRGQ